jgi:hypothetical protein
LEFYNTRHPHQSLEQDSPRGADIIFPNYATEMSQINRTEYDSIKLKLLKSPVIGTADVGML